jgi:hypothetical protein
MSLHRSSWMDKDLDQGQIPPSPPRFTPAPAGDLSIWAHLGTLQTQRLSDGIDPCASVRREECERFVLTAVDVVRHGVHLQDLPGTQRVLQQALAVRP